MELVNCVVGELVHVLLFDAGSDQEGIHSLEIAGRTVVLLFEQLDDAERYAGLLEAQDFPIPTVEALERQEMESFCSQSGYEARYVPAGFLPQTAEERLLIAPPERNMDTSLWREASEAHTETETETGTETGPLSDPIRTGNSELEEFRRRLEGLL
jgi:hypothetical protein